MAKTAASKKRDPRKPELPPAPLPAAFRPQLATLVKSAPDGEEWLHEIKFDGYRIGCRIDRGRVTLLSRSGKDWTARLPEIADAARRLRVERALIDGEAAMLVADGRTSFQALQNAFGAAARSGLVYFVFDLLHLDGRDVSAAPLAERKNVLARVVGRPRADAVIRFSEHLPGRGPAVFREACRLGLEGIVSKRRDLPYRPGRGDAWLKTKCMLRQEFVIGGFTDPRGSRVGIGALLIGVPDDSGKLVFAGKVGTGFGAELAQALRSRLERIERKTPPFDPPPPRALGRNAHWVEPELVAEVAFGEWTGDGKVRHASFQGLREDKRAEEVRREAPAAPAETVAAAVEHPAAKRRGEPR